MNVDTTIDELASVEEKSSDEERPCEYVMNGKDAKEYLGMEARLWVQISRKANMGMFLEMG